MEAFGFTLLALATVSLLGIFVLQLLGVPFRIDVTRRSDIPPMMAPPTVVETDEERRKREKEEQERARDIVTALNRYFYGDPNEGGDAK